MNRALRLERKRNRRRKVGRRSSLVVGVVVACLLTGLGVALYAQSQITSMHVCVRPNGSVYRFNSTGNDCYAGDTEVAWSVSVVNATTTTTVTTTNPTTTTLPTTTTTHPTTTTVPPTTTTQPGSVGDTKPVSGGYFSVLPHGSALPSEAYCASHIHRSTWEPRPDNFTANHKVPDHAAQLANYGQMNATWNGTYKPRINGTFTGTTDEEFQFYGCKWGWSDELLRAEAISESNWHQSQIGDSNTSFGILQIRYLYHPRVQNGCQSCVGSSWPDSQNSTPFNIDAMAAETRGVYDGMSTFLPGGDVWKDIQSWFCGCVATGNENYVTGVKQHLIDKPWLGWSG